MDIRNFSRSPSALAAAAAASSSVSIEMRDMNPPSRATSSGGLGSSPSPSSRNPHRCSQHQPRPRSESRGRRTLLSQAPASRGAHQNALGVGRGATASASSQRPSSRRRRESQNASTTTSSSSTGAASASNQLDHQRQTFLTCERCLCLRAPQSACCGSVLEKGIRSLVAASICIHGTAILIRVIEITLSGASPETTPFNFVCITPTSLSVVVSLFVLRLGWVAVCALVCAKTRSDDADLRSRNQAVTTFFFSAIAFALVMAADGLYTDLFGLGSCDLSEDSSTNSSTEDPRTAAAAAAAPSLIPESVTGIDVAYTMIITLFQLVLQGYCCYAAWGYLVFLNVTRRPPRGRGNRPRRGATNDDDHQDVVMGQLVNLDTLEGQPVEVASLVVALPRPPNPAHHGGRGGRRANSSHRNALQQTPNGFATISPSPVLPRSNFLLGSEGCAVAVATKVRRASEADMTDVPAAIVLGGGGSKERPVPSAEPNVSDTPDSLEQPSEPQVAPALPQQVAEEGTDAAVLPASQHAVSDNAPDSNDSATPTVPDGPGSNSETLEQHAPDAAIHAAPSQSALEE